MDPKNSMTHDHSRSVNRTIWKFPLPGHGISLTLGDFPKVVHVGPDPQGVPCVWVEHGHDSVHPTNLRLEIVGTGERVPRDMTHVGTFIDGRFVWHVYA